MGAKRASGTGRTAHLAIPAVPAMPEPDEPGMPGRAQSTPERELLTVPEAAIRLNISSRTAWKRVWSGELETVWIGKRRLVPRLAVTAYVRNLCVQHGAHDTSRLMAG